MTEVRRRRSRQRQRILDLLARTDSHPTANWLHDHLRTEFPSASLGNVYRNLAILEEEGHVRRLTFGSTFDRYEIAAEDHIHFVCDACGGIYDLPAPSCDELMRDVAAGHGHRVDHVRVELHGMCSDCR